MPSNGQIYQPYFLTRWRNPFQDCLKSCFCPCCTAGAVADKIDESYELYWFGTCLLGWFCLIPLRMAFREIFKLLLSLTKLLAKSASLKFENPSKKIQKHQWCFLQRSLDYMLLPALCPDSNEKRS